MKKIVRKIISFLIIIALIALGSSIMVDRTFVKAEEVTNSFQLVGSKKTVDYESFESAYEAAKNNDTIKVVASASTAQNVVISKKINLVIEEDVVFTIPYFFQIRDGELNITGTGKMLFNPAVSKCHNGIQLFGSTNPTDKNYSVLKVGKDITLEATGNGYYSVTVANNQGKAYGVVANLAGHVGLLAVNGSIQATDGYVPEITLTEDSVSDGIYAAGYAKWSFNGNVISQDTEDAITVKAGDLTFNSGTYKSHGPKSLPVEGNNNGGESSGAALTLSSNDSYGTIKVTIKGGVFESTNHAGLFEGIEYFSSKHTYAATATHVSSISIEGGVFKGATGESAFALRDVSDKRCITGGIYSSDVMKYCAYGYMTEEITTGDYAGYYKVVKAPIYIIRGTDYIIYKSFYEMLDQNDHINDPLENETLYIGRDIEQPYSKLVLDFVNENVTIDLQGNTIYSGSWAENAAYIWQGKNLTIKNGTFSTDYSGNTNHGYAIMAGDETAGSIVLEDITTVMGGVNVYNTKITFKDCIINANDVKYYGIWADENAEITIESGTYNSSKTDKNLLADDASATSFVVKGGIFNGYMGESSSVLSIEGGYFSCPVSQLEEKLAEGYTTRIYQLNDKNYNEVVYYEAYVVRNGQKYTFTTLSDLIDPVSKTVKELEKGETLYIARDINAPTTDVDLIFEAENITIDLNNHTIYSGYLANVSQGSWIGPCYLWEGNNLTIQNGTFSTDFEGCGAHEYALYIGNENIHGLATIKNITTVKGGVYICDHDVILEGCTISATDGIYYAVAPRGASTVTIKSGTYTCSNVYQNKPKSILCDVQKSVASTFEVLDGIFVGSMNDNMPQIQIKGGIYSCTADELTGKLASGYSLEQITSGEYNGYYKVVADVASVLHDTTTVNYATFEAAYEAAVNGDTITLLKDYTIVDNLTIEKTLTIDLGGFELEFNGYKRLTIFGGHLTLKNGTISATGYGGFGLKGSKDSSAVNFTSLLLESDATISARPDEYEEGGKTLYDYYGLWIKSNDNHAYGVVVDVKGDIEGTIYVEGNVKDTSGNVPQIHVYNTSTIKGIYAAGYAKWTLEGDILPDQYVCNDAISAKCGEFVINSGTYKCSMPYLAPSSTNNNGSEDTGSVITITSNSGYAQSIKLTINGGAFISENAHAIYEGVSYSGNTPSAQESFLSEISITGGFFIAKDGLESVKLAKSTATKFMTGGYYSKSPNTSYVASSYEISPYTHATYGSGYKVTQDLVIQPVDNTEVQIVISDEKKSGTTVYSPSSIDEKQAKIDEFSNNDNVNNFNDAKSSSTTIASYGADILSDDHSVSIKVYIKSINITNLYTNQNVLSSSNITKAKFNVEPVDEDGNKVSLLNQVVQFRLPVDKNFANDLTCVVYHKGVFHGYSTIKGDTNGKYIEVSTNSFSEFSYEILTGVTEDPACAIGSKGYASLVDAIAEVKNGETITLLKDFTDESESIAKLTSGSGVHYTIDLNGTTLTLAHSLSTTSGSVKFVDSSSDQSGKVSGECKLIYNSAFFIMAGTYDIDVDKASSLEGNYSANIYGGIFKASVDDFNNITTVHSIEYGTLYKVVDYNVFELQASQEATASSVGYDNVSFRSSGDYLFAEDDTITVTYKLTRSTGLGEALIALNYDDTSFSLTNAEICEGLTSKYAIEWEEGGKTIIISSLDSSTYNVVSDLGDLFTLTYTALADITDSGRQDLGIDLNNSYVSIDQDINNNKTITIDGDDAYICVREEVEITYDDDYVSMEYSGSAFDFDSLDIDVVLGTSSIGSSNFTLNYYTDSAGGLGTEITDISTITAVGKYHVTVTVPETDSYFSAFDTIDIEITKAKVTAPDADTTTFTYNTEEQTYTLTTDTLYTISGNTKTDAGTYTVTVSLTDTTNYCWSDDTVADKTYTFTINKYQIQLVFEVKTYNTAEIKYDTVNNDAHAASISWSLAIDAKYGTLAWDSTNSLYKFTLKAIKAATGDITGSTTNANYEVAGVEYKTHTVDIIDINGKTANSTSSGYNSHATFAVNNPELSIITTAGFKKGASIAVVDPDTHEVTTFETYRLTVIGFSSSYFTDAEIEYAPYPELTQYEFLGYVKPKKNTTYSAYEFDDDSNILEALTFADSEGGSDPKDESSDYSFFLCYKFGEYDLTFMGKLSGGEYEQVHTQTFIKGDSLDAVVFTNNTWFALKDSKWYTDEDLQTALVVTDIKADLTIYGLYEIDNDHLGDVNIDGAVNAADATSYRRALINSVTVRKISTSSDYLLLWDYKNKDMSEAFDFFKEEDESKVDYETFFYKETANVNKDSSSILNLNDVIAIRQAIVGGYKSKVDSTNDRIVPDFDFEMLEVSKSVKIGEVTYTQVSTQTKHEGYDKLEKFSIINSTSQYLIFTYSGNEDLDDFTASANSGNSEVTVTYTTKDNVKYLILTYDYTTVGTINVYVNEVEVFNVKVAEPL